MGIRLAVDLVGTDDAPAAAAGLRALLAGEPDLAVVAVGGDDLRRAVGAHPRLTVVEARDRIAPEDEPSRAVRARRLAGPRVAARLVRDGAADAMVSVGSPAAAAAAAVFVLGTVPGVTRPALAVALPTDTGRVLLLDAGADPTAGTATPDVLVQHAWLGAALAAAHGSARPRVALLSNGPQPWAGDRLRHEAAQLLADTTLRLVGAVGADVLVHGGGCDIVVTDGFSGALVLDALAAADPARFAGRAGIVVGVEGVVVTDRIVETGLAAALAAVRAGVVGAVRDTAGALVRRRRELAGLR